MRHHSESEFPLLVAIPGVWLALEQYKLLSRHEVPKSKPEARPYMYHC